MFGILKVMEPDRYPDIKQSYILVEDYPNDTLVVIDRMFIVVNKIIGSIIPAGITIDSSNFVNLGFEFTYSTKSLGDMLFYFKFIPIDSDIMATKFILENRHAFMIHSKTLEFYDSINIKQSSSSRLIDFKL